MNKEVDERIFNSLKHTIRNELKKPSFMSKRGKETFRVKYNDRTESDDRENIELKYMEKFATSDGGKPHLKTEVPFFSAKPMNSNIEKDVKRVLISFVIHLLVKIVNRRYVLVTGISYSLIFVNMVYLIAKVILIVRQKKLLERSERELSNESLLQTIDIVNSYKNGTNDLTNLTNTDYSMKKTFFDNISDTPLKQRQKRRNSLDFNTNTIESSYIPSTKFNYKLNSA